MRAVSSSCLQQYHTEFDGNYQSNGPIENWFCRSQQSCKYQLRTFSQLNSLFNGLILFYTGFGTSIFYIRIGSWRRRPIRDSCFVNEEIVERSWRTIMLFEVSISKLCIKFWILNPHSTIPIKFSIVDLVNTSSTILLHTIWIH